LRTILLTIKTLKLDLPLRLLLLRRATGLTQAQAASRAGISPTSLSIIESGFARDIRLSTLQKLYLSFGVSADCLLGLEHEEGLVKEFYDVASNVARIARTHCPHCDQSLNGMPHTLPECVLAMAQKKSFAFIATTLAISVDSAKLLVAEAMRSFKG
jgi:transcriptional regulator with XRE-family HTH domain